MKDDLNIREIYEKIIKDRAAHRGIILVENVKIPVKQSSPDMLKFDGKSYDFDHNTRPFSFIGEDSNLIGTINNSNGTHPFIFSSFQKIAAALGIIPFPPTMSYMAGAYKGTKFKDVPKILKKDNVSYLGDLNIENIEYFAKQQKSGIGSETRINTRSGRIWFSVPSNTLNKKVNVVVFWCREKKIKPDDLKQLNKLFKLKEFLWCATDSKNFNYFGDTYKDTPSGEIKELKSKIYPELSHDQIVDILIRSHTGFRMTPFEKMVVWELRGFDPSEIKTITGGYPTRAEYEYRSRFSESNEL